MTQTITVRGDAGSGIRFALGFGGVLAIVVGALVLLWPAKTAMVVTAIIAIYAIIAGIVYATGGIVSKTRGGWARVGLIVLGVLFIAAGIVAFANLSQTTAGLAVFLGILVGVMWIVEGITALSTLRDAASKGWSVLFAAFSIVAGIILLFAPAWGASTLWWLLGISLLILGVMNVVRAISYGRRTA